MNTELTEHDLLRLSLVSDDSTLEMLGYFMYDKAQKQKQKQNIEIQMNEQKLKEEMIEKEKHKLYTKMKENEKKIDSIIIPNAKITNIRSEH